MPLKTEISKIKTNIKEREMIVRDKLFCVKNKKKKKKSSTLYQIMNLV